MKNGLLILLLCCSLPKAVSQTLYEYNGSQTVHKLTILKLKNGDDTVSVTSGIHLKRPVVRQVLSSRGKYRFMYKTETSRDEITNAEGTVVATATDFYNITFPDGKLYAMIRISSTEWKYVLDGQDIIRGKFLKIKNKKNIEIAWIDTAIEGRELLWTMCQIKGVNLIKSRITQPITHTVFALAVIAGAVYGAQKNSTDTP